jgi:DNA-binding MarR family transcriptional regulator
MRGRHLPKECAQRCARAKKNLTELLARANHLRVEGFSAQLKAHGLSATEWRVLAALAERDGMPMMNPGARASFLSAVDQLISSAKENPAIVGGVV